jgi:hypothetical protein
MVNPAASSAAVLIRCPELNRWNTLLSASVEELNFLCAFRDDMLLPIVIAIFLLHEGTFYLRPHPNRDPVFAPCSGTSTSCPLGLKLQGPEVVGDNPNLTE